MKQLIFVGQRTPSATIAEFVFYPSGDLRAEIINLIRATPLAQQYTEAQFDEWIKKYVTIGAIPITCEYVSREAI